MSVTTTSNAHLTAALADYELHHSQPSAPAPAPAPNSQTTVETSNSSTSPLGWEEQWRRVPAHRPAVDQRGDMRDTYNNGVERNFVRVMFGGVFMMASASQVWRATGGRWNGDFFKYRVGGEW